MYQGFLINWVLREESVIVLTNTSLMLVCSFFDSLLNLFQVPRTVIQAGSYLLLELNYDPLKQQ